ncbi:MAG: hypothetical protein VX265_04380 [Myxococcota bacterium]|nr:hypothetical protein [Myxococcota bacterium]
MSDKPLHLFDSRTKDRNIQRGLLSQEEYDAFHADADDCADNAIEVATRFVYSQNGPEQEVVITKEELRALADEHAAMHNARIGVVEEPAAEA